MTKMTMDRRAADNKYFHKDFHTSLNHGVQFISEKYGYEGLVEYLSGFAKSFYAPLITDAKERGLVAIKEQIEKIYEIEEASGDLKTVLAGNKLDVAIEKCPAVEYIKKAGKTPARYFIETTATVYRTIAEEAGLKFEMISYDDETGKAHYCFTA